MARRGVDVAHDWAVFIRLGSSPATADAAVIERIQARMPGPDSDKDWRGGGKRFDLRFWVTADDSVRAAVYARRLVGDALAAEDQTDWRVMRIMVTSPSEERRAEYRGTEARVKGA